MSRHGQQQYPRPGQPAEPVRNALQYPLERESVPDSGLGAAVQNEAAERAQNWIEANMPKEAPKKETAPSPQGPRVLKVFPDRYNMVEMPLPNGQKVARYFEKDADSGQRTGEFVLESDKQAGMHYRTEHADWLRKLMPGVTEEDLLEVVLRHHNAIPTADSCQAILATMAGERAAAAKTKEGREARERKMRAEAAAEDDEDENAA